MADLAFSIYCLCEPDSLIVRYVGVTSQDVKTRFRRHLHDAKRGGSNHRCQWLRSVLATGAIPSVTTVEITSNRNREKWWIAHYRSLGCDLTNATDGGDGLVNPSQEVRDRIRRSVTGFKHTEEAKRKIAVAAKRSAAERDPAIAKANGLLLRGRKRTPEQRKNIKAGVAKAKSEKEFNYRRGPHTDEAKKKMSESVRKARAEGRGTMQHTVESKAKISEANKGNTAFLGRRHSAESKEKCRLAKLGNQHNLGRKLSDETKAKISAKKRERDEQRRLQKGG